MLVQVTGKIRTRSGSIPFCAGLVFKDGRCSEAAPILLRTCHGRTRDELREMFKRYGWVARVVAAR
jgi:hypothetical protein